MCAVRRSGSGVVFVFSSVPKTSTKESIDIEQRTTFLLFNNVEIFAWMKEVSLGRPIKKTTSGLDLERRKTR